MSAAQRLDERVRQLGTPQLKAAAAGLERQIKTLPAERRQEPRIAWQAITRELIARGEIKVEE